MPRCLGVARSSPISLAAIQNRRGRESPRFAFLAQAAFVISDNNIKQATEFKKGACATSVTSATPSRKPLCFPQQTSPAHYALVVLQLGKNGVAPSEIRSRLQLWCSNLLPAGKRFTLPASTLEVCAPSHISGITCTEEQLPWPHIYPFFDSSGVRWSLASAMVVARVGAASFCIEHHSGIQ